jgi:hypothetical protein
MEIAGTTTDPEAIRDAFGEAARTIPDDLRIFDMTGVTDGGHLARAVFAAHVLNGEFLAVPIPVPAGTVMR